MLEMTKRVFSASSKVRFSQVKQKTDEDQTQVACISITKCSGLLEGRYGLGHQQLNAIHLQQLLSIYTEFGRVLQRLDDEFRETSFGILVIM